MNLLQVERARRWVGLGLLVGVVGTTAWTLSPGVPVLWAPQASEPAKQSGLALFNRDWQSPADKAQAADATAEELRLAKLKVGPVFNASSCVACHFDAGVGGAGPNTVNVTSFTILPTTANPHVQEGTVHRFALSDNTQETVDLVRRLYSKPVQVAGNQSLTPQQRQDSNPVRVTAVNTPALFGAGWIDRIPSKAITHRYFAVGMKEVAANLSGDFKQTVPMGRYRILSDGRVGKFGWKAQFATLEEFVGAACANELGLSNPKMQRAKPLAGAKDESAVAAPEKTASLSRKEFGVMVAFVDTLPRPIEAVSRDSATRAAVKHGREVFSSVGCAVCHQPDLGGVKGVYSDFLLHRLREKVAASGYYEPPPMPLPEEHPDLDEWKTPPLWGVADSAPYMHDGSAATLEGAIEDHLGDAKSVTQAYKRLPGDDQAALIAFLKSLKAPPSAIPAPQAESHALASVTTP
ncbi:MAG: c-type cytochrome [Planctomycetota bacterium]|nr:c-type cytochrome [Planctomycetota bacterium]